MDGVCGITYDVDVNTAANWLSFTVKDAGQWLPEAAYYIVDAHLKGDATEFRAVYPGHGDKVLANNPTKTLTNLLPGRRYQVSFRAYKSDGTEVYTDKKPMIKSAVTHCGCSANDYSTDVANTILSSNVFTGTPKTLTVQQENGFVSFSFVADSRCEESYAFSRDNEAFTSNFAYLPAKRCNGDKVVKGRQAADDLSLSKLVVGQTYRYCTRAVARK